MTDMWPYVGLCDTTQSGVICISFVSHTYCDNPSLLQLINAAIINIYGSLTVAVCHVITVGLIAFTNIQIFLACFRNKGTDTRSITDLCHILFVCSVLSYLNVWAFSQ